MSRHTVPLPHLTRRELQIMDIVWTRGPSSVRDILTALPKNDQPAYTIVQTMVRRLARKGAVRRVARLRNADIFSAAIARDAVMRRSIEDCVALARGDVRLVLTQLFEHGFVTAHDVAEVSRTL